MEMDNDTLEMYMQSYNSHRERGDDVMNAKCRIIEEGCPVKTADEIVKAFGEEDEDEDA